MTQLSESRLNDKYNPASRASLPTTPVAGEASDSTLMICTHCQEPLTPYTKIWPFLWCIFSSAHRKSQIVETSMNTFWMSRM